MVRLRIIITAAVCLCLLAGASNVMALESSGRTSFQVRFWEDSFTNSEENETHVPVYLYLNQHWSDIIKDNENLTFDFYGRVKGDQQLSKDKTDFELYYATLKYRQLIAGGESWGGMDVDLGRIYLNQGFDLSRMDGALFRFNQILKWIDFNAYVGSYEKYEFNAGEDNGTVYGGGLSIVGLKGHRFNLYYQEGEGDETTLKRAGADFYSRFCSQFSLYGATEYDFLYQRFYESSVGFSLFPSSWINLSADAARYEPNFPADSIYNNFNYDTQDTVNVRSRIRWNDKLRTTLGYTFINYLESVTQEDYYRVDAEYRLTDTLKTTCGANIYAGEDQDKQTFEAGIDAKMTEALRTKASVGYGYYHFDKDTTADNSLSFSLNTKYKIDEHFTFTGKLEYFDSQVYDYYTRGLLRLDYNW